MPEVFVGLGSNVDRENSITAALQALADHFGPLTVSSIYESASVGFVGDPFFNLVVGFQTSLAALDVSAALSAIERDLGRMREAAKFSARTLDLDLLLYGNQVLEADNLRVPRDDITRYAFVLEPLSEVAAHLEHPVSGETFAALWAAYDKGQLHQRRLELSLLPS
jgi:2-amino-4-hydroxy-6-hydroxymethyldihydropteridine diphosphokinase